MKTFNTLLVLCIAAACLYASPVDIMIGARGYGMGGAYVALSRDASASYWNPAGLAFVENLTLMESNWIFQDITGLNINYFSFTIPVKYLGTASGSWLYKYARFSQGEDEEINTAGEHTFSLSIGKKLWNELLFFRNTSIGFSVNRHAFLTNNGNGTGLGFDLGLLTEFPLGFSFAVAGRNLATDVMGEKIDPEIRIGFGNTTILNEMHRISVAVDGLYKMNRDYKDENELSPARNNIRGFGGLEYALIWNGWEFAVRGGGTGALYNTLNTYGFAAGLGIVYNQYSFQYAFKGDTDRNAALGYQHRADLLVELKNIFKK